MPAHSGFFTQKLFNHGQALQKGTSWNIKLLYATNEG